MQRKGSNVLLWRRQVGQVSDEWNWAWNTSMMKLKIKRHDVGTALSRNCAGVKMYLHFRSQLFFNSCKKIYLFVTINKRVILS